MNDNSYPLVSIYIPTRNRSELLSRAILSVINQSYENIEVVVCSDGSTDDTDLVISKLQRKYPGKIKYLKHASSKGACKARNNAILNSSGDYITGLDDDDYFTESHIMSLYSFLISTGQQVVFPRHKIKKEDIKDKPQISNIVDVESLMNGNIVGNQIFCNREIFLKAGLFDEKLPALQDYELWLRVVNLVGQLKQNPEPSYIVDVSHAHERITKSPIKVSAAVDHILDKHIDLFSNGKKCLILATKYKYSGQKLLTKEFLSDLVLKNPKLGLKVLLKRFLRKIDAI
ncbi:glycosyltransferase [Vibrio antiquarius]|uniref:glycosyltransferase n=1 Tax=Vibrio antiquarius (strain Ex25) TaxID=150340 RepID=UPI00265A8A57|nr:glycosyltransferase [Vibrio antiquarius]MCR9849265.1 glycosyltransferase [Vibrio antiquarius]MCR9911430.1 glycosyltransferase [Vibrio antiquarius]